eukprot:scaffold103130_cov33-Phaeocystis_antarctica.AAC.1
MPRARPTSCPTTGRSLCALLRSHPRTAARAATLRHSVNLAHAQPGKDFGIICEICWRKEDSGVVCQLAGMPGIVLSVTPSP